MKPYMIRVSGSGKLADMRQRQVWLKTSVVREGDRLKAVTYVVLNGEPHVATSYIDLRPIALAAKKLSALPQVGAKFKFNPIKKKGGGDSKGVFGFLTKSKLVGKVNEDFSKILNKKGVKFAAALVNPAGYALARGGSSALSRKGGALEKAKGFGKGYAEATAERLANPVVTTAATALGMGGIVAQFQKAAATTANAFDRDRGYTGAALDISSSAVTSLAAANTGLAAIEAEGDLKRSIEKAARESGVAKGLAKKVKKAALENGEAAVKAALAKNPALTKVLKDGQKAQAALSSLSMSKDEMQKIINDAELARAKFKEIAAAAKFATDPKIRDQARKLARIVRIAAEARGKVKGIAEKNAGGLPGLFIDAQGRIRKGRFARSLEKANTEPGLLYQGPDDGNKLGRFERVITLEEAAELEEAREVSAQAEALRKKVADDAKQSAREYVKTKQVLTNAQKGDALKAKAALANAGNLSPAQRSALGNLLGQRLKEKAQARTEAVKRSREKLARKVALLKKSTNAGKVIAKNAAEKNAKEYAAFMRRSEAEKKVDVAKAATTLQKFRGTPAQKKFLGKELINRVKQKAAARDAGVQAKKNKALSSIKVMKAFNAPGAQIGCSCQEKVGYDCIRVAGPMDRYGIDRRVQDKLAASYLRNV